MRLKILFALILILLPTGAAATITTFELGNYSVSIDYLITDREYMRGSSDIASANAVRFNGTEPSALTEIVVTESDRPIFNTTNMTIAGLILAALSYADVESLTNDNLSHNTAWADTSKPYYGIIGSGSLARNGTNINVYTAPINDYATITVTSTNSDGGFSDLLSDLVVTENEDTPRSRAKYISDRLSGDSPPIERENAVEMKANGITDRTNT